MHEYLREIQKRIELESSVPPVVSDELILNVLHHVIGDPTSVDAVWHPASGFMYLKLAEENGITYRLHAWTHVVGKFDRVSWQSIHNHIWTLTSYIVCGRLKNHIYQITQTKDEPTHRVYEVEYKGLTNNLIASETLVSCKKISTDVILKGHSYHVSSGIFHSTEVAVDDTVCSFVVARQSYHKKPKVLGEINGQPIYNMQRHSCTSEEIVEALQRIVTVLVDDA